MALPLSDTPKLNKKESDKFRKMAMANYTKKLSIKDMDKIIQGIKGDEK
jgi:hypothetical protein